MTELKKILVAEDELTNSLLLKRLLTKAGYSVVLAHNGLDALKHLEHEQFDVLLSDWMMPQMDGIELIRKTRELIHPLPLIIMVTALVSESAKNYALESGADDYVSKPIEIDEILTRIKDGLERRRQAPPEKIQNVVIKTSNVIPKCVAVVIATSTGGPPTLIQFFQSMPQNLNAVFYIVQHGPPWMLETFSQRLQKETGLKVNLAVHGTDSESGNVYIAPGDMHLRIESGTYKLLLDDGPKENFVRPAADPLFRSASEAFGKYCVGVVLTGLGRDGTQGAAQVVSANGVVWVQDPSTAIAPSMPRTVIESGIHHKVAPIAKLGKLVSETIFPLAAQLKIMNQSK